MELRSADKPLVICDFEETYAEHKAEIVKESQRSVALLRIPDDDVVLDRRPLSFVAEFKVPKDNASLTAVPSPAREVLQLFQGNTRTVQVTRKYEQFSKYPTVDVAASVADFKQSLKYDIDAIEDENAATTARPTIKNLFPDNPDRRRSQIVDLQFDSAVLETGAVARLSNGKDFDQDFDKIERPALTSIFTADDAAGVENVTDDTGKKRRVTITLNSVEWQGSIKTRLAGSLVLYDCVAKRRITESAQFDYKPESGIGAAKSFTFDVTAPNADVALFVRLEKPFDGEVGAWLESYAKDKVVLDSSRETMQPFGWTCLFLFASDFLGETAEEGKEQWETDWLYRFDETKMADTELYAACLGQKGKAGKKSKSIPVKMSMTLHETSASAPIDGKSTNWMEEFQNSNAAYVPLAISAYRSVHNLFCFPVSLNIQKGSAGWNNMAIKCQLASSDDASNPNRFIPCFQNGDGSLRESFTVAVNYHNRMPTYNEEIKVVLPLNLPAKSHLFFTFTHVSFKHKRDDEVAGYAFLPLLKRNVFIADGDVSLPFCTSLASSYIDDVAGSGKWIDGKKPIFIISVRLSSCLLVQDPKLGHFFDITSTPTINENEVAAAVRDLTESSPSSLAKFFAVAVDRLLDLICTASPIIRKKCFRSLIAVISATSTEKGQAPVVSTYIRDMFCKRSTWTQSLHEELVTNWTSLMQEKDPYCRDVVRHSWTLFEMIWKSCALEKSSAGKVDLISRGQLFKAEFLQSLGILLDELSSEVYRLAKGGLNIGNTLNEAMARFLNNCLSTLPPGCIFKKIRDHIAGFDKAIAVHEFMKFDFLQIVCGYEHAVPLSLPIRSVFNVEKPAVFWNNCKRFYFPYLLIEQIVQCFKLSTEKARLKAFNCLHRVLAKVEMDNRFTVFDRQIIFNMFLPYVTALCDNIALFQELKENDPQPVDGAKPFSLAERKLLLTSLAFIVRYMDTKFLAKWVEKDNTTRTTAFFHLMVVLPSTFQYVGKKALTELWTKGVSIIPKTSTDDAKKFIENAYKAPSQAGNLRELRGTLRAQGAGTTKQAAKFNTATNSRSLNATTSSTLSSEEATQGIKWMALQAHETSLLTANILYLLCDLLKAHFISGPFEELEGVMTTVENLITIPQNSVSANVCVRVLAKYIKEFSQLVLKGNRICSELCWSLLRAGSSPFGETRAYVADCIYILLRLNFSETKKHFGKVKTQLTVALSKIDCLHPANLKVSLMLVSKFAEADALQTKAFHKMCYDGVQALVGILKNNIKLNNHRDDAEMLQDMYYSLANSYSGAPDLRLTVLETLSGLHTAAGNFAEAGFCILSCAALVAEYLKFKGLDYGTAMGSGQFIHCSPNISEGAFFRGDVNPELEGNCQSTMFSEYGFLNLIDQAAALFSKAYLHEVAIESYKLVLPIHEKRKNFHQLIRVHGCIRSCYEDIVNTMGKRILATFFRVDLFGSKFGDLDGHTYIYKEKSVTQLSEIVSRLTAVFRKKFGDDFELINDSTAIDRSKHDPSKAYVAIAFCEPYHSPEDLKRKTTYYERMNGLNKFYYEMPYTLVPGKSHGDVEQQYKRKIILTTATSFPHIRKRLQVTATETIELTPIEVSIEAISDRCEKLRAVVEAEPLNLKNLQLLLQGSVRAQVNKGPLEFASIFLDPEKHRKFNPDKVKQLRLKFRDLIDYCAQALKLSKLHAPADQADYNEDLEEGYTYLKLKLEAFIGDLKDGVPLAVLSPSVSNSKQNIAPHDLLSNFLKS